MTEAAREIEALLYTYAERIDAGDLDGVAELFRHGRIAGMPDPPPEAVFEGVDAVRGLYEGTVILHDDGTPRTRHVTTNVIVEVDDEGGTASGRSYYTVTQALPDFPLQVIVTGRYHDTFRRVDGRWWFDTRTMIVDQAGDLSRHLRDGLGGPDGAR